jgi:hypothetical protein
VPLTPPVRRSALRAALLLSLGPAVAGIGIALEAGTSPAQAPSLPATRPTGTETAAAAPAPASVQPASSAPRPRPPHPAQVAYARGLLQVTADDSSLDQILREIGRQTGMKITGSLADERVFGRYGPAAPGTVVALLLDGSGSNMLLRAASPGRSAELVLTPRHGGPTPPDLNAGGQQQPAARVWRMPQAGVPPPQPGWSPAPPPPGAGAVGAGAQPGQPGAAAGAAADSAADPSQPRSPNGVGTPQQIFQQLQQLQQQQPANPK